MHATPQHRDSFGIPAHTDADGMAVVGRTLHDLRGIRFDEGTGGNQPAAPAPGANPPAPQSTAPGTEPTAPAAQSTTATPPAAPAPNPALGPDGNPWDPARAGARIAEVNAEAKANRERATALEAEKAASDKRLADVLAALGLKPDGSAAEKTPEQLAAEVSQATTRQDEIARENIVLRVAGATVNADRLLDSRGFVTELSALKADDRAGVEALVNTWVQKDPTLTVTPAAAASGGAGHTGTAPSTARKSREAAIAERYGAPRSTSAR